MAVVVIAVRFFAGDADTHHDDEGGEHIRGGVNGVGEHSAGVSQNTGGQLESGQDKVTNDGVAGDLHSQFGVVGLYMGGSHREDLL